MSALAWAIVIAALAAFVFGLRRFQESVEQDRTRSDHAEDDETDCSDDLAMSSDAPPVPEKVSDEAQALLNSRLGSLMDYAEGGDGDADRSFKQGLPSAHKRGVLYLGPWEHPADGFQEHVRRSARALHGAGVPVHLRSLLPTIRTTAEDSEEELVEKSVFDLIHASVGTYSATVHQVVPNSGLLERLTTPTALGAQVFTPEQWEIQNRLRVLYVVYEYTPISEKDLSALRKVGQVWTACERDADALVRGGVEAGRVRVIPVCFQPNDPLLSLRKIKNDVKEEGVPRFYHIGKWEPRKAADRILGAFMRAFKPGAAKLYIKTNLARVTFDGFPHTPEDAVKARLRDPVVKYNGWTEENWSESITIQTGWMPASEIVKIHAWGDAYVSLSRGEGFDMPAFDAKLIGNLLVYTPSGGPQDFADDSDVRVEPSGEMTCHAVYHWGPDAKYLDYKMNTATEAMTAAYAKVMERREKSYSAPPLEQTKLIEFSEERVGQKMRKALQDLVGPEGKLVEP